MYLDSHCGRRGRSCRVWSILAIIPRLIVLFKIRIAVGIALAHHLAVAQYLVSLHGDVGRGRVTCGQTSIRPRDVLGIETTGPAPAVVLLLSVPKLGAEMKELGLTRVAAGFVEQWPVPDRGRTLGCSEPRES